MDKETPPPKKKISQWLKERQDLKKQKDEHRVTEKKDKFLARRSTWVLILLVVGSLVFSEVTRDVTHTWMRDKQDRETYLILKMLGIGPPQ